VIDVLVVGGGPVGLAAAIGCAQAGLSVAVLEPRGVPVDKACGEGVMPAGIRRLAALGVDPPGYPLCGIRYTDGRHQADARFSRGEGRGVRRTALHAALAQRALALGIPVLPSRVTAFKQHDGHVSAAGVDARYLVAADGLHSGIRRALERDATVSARPGPAGRRGRTGGGVPAGPPPRYGLRRHFRVAPWTDLVEVHWSARAEAYVTPVADDVVGVAVLFDRPERAARRGNASASGNGNGSATGNGHGTGNGSANGNGGTQAHSGTHANGNGGTHANGNGHGHEDAPIKMKRERSEPVAASGERERPERAERGDRAERERAKSDPGETVPPGTVN